MDRSSDGPHVAGSRRAPGAGPLDPPNLPSAEGVLGGAGLGRELERWAADAAVDAAARARARARWLRIQADESATLAGTLMALAERAQPVVVDVVDQRFRGVVAAIGEDFVALHTDVDQQVLIRTAAIGVVRTEPGGTTVVGDRSPLLEVSLASVLVPMSADRPTVLVRTLAGTSIRGELRAAGTDVVRLRADGDPPTPAWVPVDAIAVVALHP